MKNAAKISVQVEAERIKALKKYDILDTPPDGSFDNLTKLAAKLLDMPIALISLVDTDRIWFKSRFGLDVSQINRDPGLCASAILSDEIYLVEDTKKDPRTLANPLVAGQLGLRFYAAVPLKVQGYNLGTFCVLDKNPRRFTEEQKELLQTLADIVIDQMELRLAARKAIYNQNQMLSIFAHDLKNPLSTIVLGAELIKEEKNDGQAFEETLYRIINAGKKSMALIEDLLESARREANEIQFHFKKIDFSNLIVDVVTTNQILADNKNQKIQLNIEANPLVLADERKLFEVADNLINNAIKYSPKNKNIVITIKERNNKVILEVWDEGPGFTEEEKEHLFQRFSRLSAKPTGGESATGLGLSIVKTLVEAHQGKVLAKSEGKDKGSKFSIEIPVIK
ncbi:MAG: histidine kinase [Ferruginibacter sp.]|uniref:GAF domain-containing sensor histidine kinase n=1 Tax=Ferruginibacter sp. TaxID=1940288 RepID=UPI002658DF42|nr:GAF domain-containing sensor histidine kinase [Ferruginibacter sp.]MDB5279744.1 histidine kinase [Ferruginibacter sp.]